MTTCWFCGKRIWPGKATNRHHVIPKRLLKGNKNKGNLVVLVHRECHCDWHRDLDLPMAGFSVFIVWMHVIQFGYRIYEQERHHADIAQAIPVGSVPVSA